MKLADILRRHPIFYSTRFWLTIKKPKAGDFSEEHCNKYICHEMIPSEFKNEIALVGVSPNEGTFEGARKIIQYMSDHYGTGRGLGHSTVEILSGLKKRTGGVCSDYSSVFTALCLANKIKVREWGLVANLKYKLKTKNLGHSFNEIFCDHLGKWVLLDPYYGIYFVNKDTAAPLSATELIDLHGFDKSRIALVYFIHNRKLEPDSLLKIVNCYYRQNVFFLLKDYNIFSQDSILRMHKRLPLPVLHFLLILSKRYHNYIVYLNDHNRGLMKSQLRTVLKFNYS